MADRWIVVVHWDRFQHYKDRDPVWIKNYTRLLHDDAYMALPLSTSGLLHRLWLLYASAGRYVSESEARRVLVRSDGDAKHWRSHIERLNRAGFIRVFASKSLAHRYQLASPEVEVLRTSTKRPLAPDAGGGANGPRKELCPECGTGGGYHVADCSRAS